MSKKIRVWTIGYLNKDDITQSIFPTKQRIGKLKEDIESAVDGDVSDIVVGPDITVQVFEADEDIVEAKDPSNFTVKRERARRIRKCVDVLKGYHYFTEGQDAYAAFELLESVADELDPK